MMNNTFNKLIENVCNTHYQLHDNTVKVINRTLTLRNWLIGLYIVEYEQKGSDRAKYGDNIIDNLSVELKKKNLKGFTKTNLRSFRSFYINYPQIRQSLTDELQCAHNDVLSSNLSIHQSLTGEFDIPTEILISNLTFTHFVELIKIRDNNERLFYESESIQNYWSVRELKRAIDSQLYLRVSHSINKTKVISDIKKLAPQNISDIILDPYILDFLQLEEKPEYTESDLEEHILTHLQSFLLELGKGFCFEARQKRITIGNRNYRLDLLFYHRILKCNILIDLKLGEYTHADAGQMNFYLNWFKKNEMYEGDNPPIGIILCAGKDETLVEYTTDNIDNMFVSRYLTQLPSKKELECFIKGRLK